MFKKMSSINKNTILNVIMVSHNNNNAGLLCDKTEQNAIQNIHQKVKLILVF